MSQRNRRGDPQVLARGRPVGTRPEVPHRDGDVVLGGRADHEWAADPTSREVVEELLVGLDLETTDALLASDEYADEVRTQDETARSLSITQLPPVVVETTWTLAGVQSQNDYVQALREIHDEWLGSSS